MNVGHVTETYSQLGRLGRGISARPEPQEQQAMPDRTASGLALPLIKPSETRPGQDLDVKLNLEKALTLTGRLAETLAAETNPTLGVFLHDLGSINLIPPRYI
ncbi:MAG: hypothetical protein AB1896_20010 [Thermodesulfobacteriota bacterium]